MKLIEDKLEELDEYFETKKESEKWLIIAGIAAVIALLGYNYFLPYAEEKYNKSNGILQSIEKKTQSSKGYLQSIQIMGSHDKYLEKLDAQLKNKIQKNKVISKNINLIDTSLIKLSDMLFDQKSWSNFLDNITKYALDYKLELQYISNAYIDDNTSFGHVLQVEIGAKGKYRNIIEFMNKIEQNRLVTDVYGSQIYPDGVGSEVYADINISVWGVNH